MNTKPVYDGEVIVMINDKTGIIVERNFNNRENADFFEQHLDLMEVHYQRWSEGILLWEENAT